MVSNRHGQSTVEVAVLFAVIVAALIGMQIYLKRGAMGKLKDTADQIGEQFSPLHTTSAFNTSYTSGRHEVTVGTGSATSAITVPEVQSRGQGTQNTGLLSDETVYQ